MANPSEQLTPRLRRWGTFHELDGAPLRRVVGRAPGGNLLDQLDELNAALRELAGNTLPTPDARRVRKSVGKVK